MATIAASLMTVVSIGFALLMMTLTLASMQFSFFFQAEDGIRDYKGLEFRRVLFRSVDPRRCTADRGKQRLRSLRACPPRRDRRHHQLPPGRARLPRAPGPRRPARWPVRQLPVHGSAG